ncbi:MAG: hypothetical protein AAGC99_14235 [Pseudomonadota bacterium]
MAALLGDWVSATAFSSTLGAPAAFDVSAGDDRLLIVQTALRSTSSASITALSYGGQPMTLIRRDTVEAGSDLDIAWWYLDDDDIENASGNELTTTLNAASPANPHLIVSFATYEDVDQTSPIEDAGFGDEATGGGTPTASAVTTTTDGVVIAALNCNRGSSDAGATEDGSFSNMTDQQETQTTRSYAITADASTDGSNFTPTFTITHEDECLLSAFSIADAATAQTVDVGQASETDTALSITPARSLEIGVASEINSALAITPADAPARAVTIGLAEETNTAQPVTHRRVVIVGLAQEVNTALAMTVPGRRSLAALARRNNAGSGRSRQRLPVYPSDVERLLNEAQAITGRDRKTMVSAILQAVDRGAKILFTVEVESGDIPSQEVLRQRRTSALSLAAIHQAKASARRDHLSGVLSGPPIKAQPRMPRLQVEHIADLFRSSRRRGL